MAPAAKEKILPDGFLRREDGKKIQCTLCTAVSPTRTEIWIEWASLNTHLKSGGHSRAIENHQIARTQAAEMEKNLQDDLARRRDREMQFSALRDVQIPVPEQQRAWRVQSTAERELEEQLETDLHGAGFDLGTDKTTQQYYDLCNEMNSLWNAGTMSHSSGFSLGEGNTEEILPADDEDDFLAEIMQNAGACR